MIAPEQSVVRKTRVSRKAREAAARRAAEAQSAGRFDTVIDKLIGFVVTTRKQKYKPFIGRIIAAPGDADAMVHVIGDLPPRNTLRMALGYFADDRVAIALVLRQPVPRGGMIGHRLSHMLSFQTEPLGAAWDGITVLPGDAGDDQAALNGADDGEPVALVAVPITAARITG